MVWTGPLGRAERLWPDQVAVPGAEPDDLDWLNRHADLAGQRTEYVRAGGRDDRTWLRMESIRG